MEDITITKTEFYDDRNLTIWHTSVPGVVVRRHVMDAGNETREILFTSAKGVVIDRGPTVHKDTLFANKLTTYYVTWPSGKARSREEIKLEIAYRRIALWMYDEMVAGVEVARDA